MRVKFRVDVVVDVMTSRVHSVVISMDIFIMMSKSHVFVTYIVESMHGLCDVIVSACKENEEKVKSHVNILVIIVHSMQVES